MMLLIFFPALNEAIKPKVPHINAFHPSMLDVLDKIGYLSYIDIACADNFHRIK